MEASSHIFCHGTGESDGFDMFKLRYTWIIASVICMLLVLAACSGAGTTSPKIGDSTEQTTMPSTTGSAPHTSTTTFKSFNPMMMTIRSGKNSIQAEPNVLWSHNLKTNVSADFARHMPQEMVHSVPYLTLDDARDLPVPFIPYVKSDEVFGQYTVYDEKLKQLPFKESSGRYPQIDLFAQASPGKYLVSLTMTYETAESRSGYQYFFGVIVPDRQPETTSTGPVSVNPDPVGAYLVVIDHLIENRRIPASSRQYLAIDTSKLPNLSASDKERLFQGLKKYNLQLFDKTYDTLKAEGYAESGWSFTDGVFIVLKDIHLKGSVMTLDAAIYLDALNAYGLDDFDVTWLDTHWEITRTHMTWVS